MSDWSGIYRHKRIHQEASEKVWDSGHWFVAQITGQHSDYEVVEFRRRKFPDLMWVTIDALDNGYVPDFDDTSLYLEEQNK